jgi:hypothetical protein
LGSSIWENNIEEKEVREMREWASRRLLLMMDDDNDVYLE